MNPTTNAFFCTTMGAPLPWEVDVYFLRGREAPRRTKPSDIFLPRQPPPSPPPRSKATLNSIRSCQNSGSQNGSWLSWFFGASLCKSAAVPDPSEPKDTNTHLSATVLSVKGKGDDTKCTISDQEKSSSSAAVESIWSALFPTTHCQCCSLERGHMYAKTCGRATYKKFDPADISCYSSIYGSDAGFVFWSLVLSDVGKYIELTKDSGAEQTQIKAALKIWDKVVIRLEKLLQGARCASPEDKGVSLPMQAGKCRIIAVPAPEDGMKSRGVRKRWVWVRCKDPKCAISGRRRTRPDRIDDKKNHLETLSKKIFVAAPPRSSCALTAIVEEVEEEQSLCEGSAWGD